MFAALPDILWKPVLDEIFVFVLVFANINQVVIFAGPVADRVKVQHHRVHWLLTSDVASSLEPPVAVVFWSVTDCWATLFPESSWLPHARRPWGSDISLQLDLGNRVQAAANSSQSC